MKLGNWLILASGIVFGYSLSHLFIRWCVQ